MNYIVFDMEWNQPFSREQTVRTPVVLTGEVIQIGAVKLDADFKKVDTFKINIRPVRYTHMQWSVRRLTGISDKDLKNGVRFSEAYASFAKWCGEDAEFITWGFDDVPMLRTNAALHGENESLTEKWYNLQTVFDRQIAHENRQCSLTRALERVGATFDDTTAHDALTDAEWTAELCTHLDMKAGLAGYAPTFTDYIFDGYDGNFRQSDAALDFKTVSFRCSCGAKHTLPASAFIRVGRYKLAALTDCGTKKLYVRVAAERRRQRSYRRRITVCTANPEQLALFEKTANVPEENQ